MWEEILNYLPNHFSMRQGNIEQGKHSPSSLELENNSETKEEIGSVPTKNYTMKFN